MNKPCLIFPEQGGGGGDPKKHHRRASPGVSPISARAENLRAAHRKPRGLAAHPASPMSPTSQGRKPMSRDNP